jgi:hypothetical protein
VVLGNLDLKLLTLQKILIQITKAKEHLTHQHQQQLGLGLGMVMVMVRRIKIKRIGLEKELGMVMMIRRAVKKREGKRERKRKTRKIIRRVRFLLYQKDIKCLSLHELGVIRMMMM